MVEIDASKLPRERVNELKGFLEKKLSTDVKEASGKITVESVSKNRLRMAIRWFLSRNDLSEEYRVLADGGNLVVKKRKD